MINQVSKVVLDHLCHSFVIHNMKLNKILCFITKITYLSVRIIDLVSHTTYDVCVNFIPGTCSLKSNPNDWFFEKLFMAISFHSPTI